MDYPQKNKNDQYSDIWLTPLPLFKQLDKEFKFNLDPATEPNNPLGTKQFFTKAENGLLQQWNGNVFCNPPYSQIELWIKKAKEEWEREREREIVLLIPARTDTKYFHNLIVPFAEVRFIMGRIKFSEKGTAPFPSMLVIFGKKPNIKQFIKEAK